MPFFAYKGRNSYGEMVRGVLEGSNSGAVADQLFNTGVTPVEIVATRKPVAAGQGGWQVRLTEGRVREIDVMMFCRQMYTLLKAGVPILRALSGLRESTQNLAFKRVLADIRESLDTGREMSVALRRHPKVFSSFYVSMVRVGESTGMLEDVFLRLFYYLEFEKNTRDQIKAALRYPSFVVTAIVIALIVINLVVIPAFAKVYSTIKVELPLMTRILLAVSNFMVHYWPAMLVGAIGAFVGIKLYVNSPRGKYRWDKAKLRLPLAGSIIFKATLARFSRSFSLAYKSGIPIVQGLSVVALVVDNDHIASRIEQMRNSVERGESILRTAIATGVFSPIVLQMIAVGEETGELDSLMQEVAEMYEREVEYDVKKLSDKIEPILIIGLAVIVMVLALGVFLPIWELGNAMMHHRTG
ncbi:MAG: type II secretion system F family protein [Sulfuricella sp.]|nr:type II secretion system F family protein [Sulfuricella sp.]